jgi:Fur family ferric uptake transcriptional regulator
VSSTNKESGGEGAERVREAIGAIGVRATQQRKAIAARLVSLGESGEAFTAESLLAGLNKEGAGIGRATVFRTIEKLVSLGLIDRVEFADGERWYRLCSGEHHHHLSCRLCHKVVEVELCLPEAKIAAIGAREGFTIEGHEISLFGICDECRAKEGGKP